MSAAQRGSRPTCPHSTARPRGHAGWPLRGAQQRRRDAVDRGPVLTRAGPVRGARSACTRHTSPRECSTAPARLFRAGLDERVAVGPRRLVAAVADAPSAPSRGVVNSCRHLERSPSDLDRWQTGSHPGLGSFPVPPAGFSAAEPESGSTAAARRRRRGARPTTAAGVTTDRTEQRDGRIERATGTRDVRTAGELQELESELDRYIHDVENGATVVVSRDGRQVARIIPEADSAEQKRTALKASGTFDWSGRRPKSRRPSVRLRDGGSVSDIIINERR